MDLVSASTEKLEPLPESSSQQLSAAEKEEEKKWLEDITEKAGRGGAMHLQQAYVYSVEMFSYRQNYYCICSHIIQFFSLNAK